MKRQFKLSPLNFRSFRGWGSLLLWGPLVGVGILLFLFWGDLQDKLNQEKKGRTVAWVVDWEDIQIFSKRESVPVGSLLEKLQSIPVVRVAASFKLSVKQENRLRKKGFAILWRDEPDQATPRNLNRLKKGDGILGLGEWAFGYPRRLNEVAKAVSNVSGFIPWVEFAPQKGGLALLQAAGYPGIKTHCLQAKEQMADKRHLWIPRLIRAVQKRGVRLLYHQLSPALTWEENHQFQKTVTSLLRGLGYEFGNPDYFSEWSYLKGRNHGIRSHRVRMCLVFLLGLWVPVMGILCVKLFKGKPPVLTFLSVSFLSLLGGLAIHSLGSFPEAVFGYSPVRGVKALLLVPMGLLFIFLVEPSSWRSFLGSPLKGWHGVIFIGVVGVFIGGTLMRSGNFPLIPVTDSERIFRDGMESFFGARPRFKEFLIGHPLLLLGLFLQTKKQNGPSHFVQDGRLWIYLGMLGQISIVNTFLHFHAPLGSGMLRTFHGLWLGILISIPLCYFYPKFENSLERDPHD